MRELRKEGGREREREREREGGGSPLLCPVECEQTHKQRKES